MKVIILGALMVGALVLSGCSTTGGEDKFSSSYVQSHITEGKTTKAEVQNMYGVPDENSKSSNGTTWVYQRRGNMNDVSSLASYIPGAGAVSSALGMANSADQASSSANKVMSKRTGNTEVHGDRLYITFRNNDVVDYWSID